MKINFFIIDNNQDRNLISDINDLKNGITNINNKLNWLENKIDAKFIILDHDLNEIKIIIKNLEKNNL